MALRILGIDLGTHSVKVAELRSSFRSVELVSLRRALVLREGPGTATLDEQLAALTEISGTATGVARPDVVVVSLPGAGAATHRLGFPFSDLRRLELTLGFEIEGQIPFDLVDVLYDYEVLSQVAKKGLVPPRMEVLVGVARKTAVSELLTGLARVGFDPRIVTLPGLALHQLPLPEGGTDAVIDIGHTRVGIVAREDGRATLARTFDGGGQALTAALVRVRGWNWSEAEGFKEQASLRRGDPEVQQALTRALLPTVREVRQTLRQVSGLTRKPIERLWLTGGSAALDGLPELLTRELGVTAEPLPTFALPGGELSADDVRFGSLALGLALRGHSGNRSSRFNLRRGDQSFQGDFARVRGRLLRFGALSAALFLLFGVRAYAELYLLGKREKQIDDAICAQTKQAVNKCVKDPTLAHSLLAAAGGSSESTIPEQSAVGMLAETTSRLNLEGAKLTALDVAVDQLELDGEADSFETVDKVVNALKGYHCFSDVQRGRVQRNRDATQIEFRLSARSDCAATGSVTP